MFIIVLTMLIISIDVIVDYFALTFIAYRLHQNGILRIDSVRSNRGYTEFRREFASWLWEQVRA